MDLFTQFPAVAACTLVLARSAWCATEAAPAFAATATSIAFSDGFGMNSNRHPCPSSDVLFFGDASLGRVSNLQHIGNVKMSLQPMVF